MSYENLTFVISLPRSRTAWMAWFLGHGITAWHDPLKNCASISELGKKIDAHNAPLVVIDTAMLFFCDEIVRRFPGAKFLVILRNIFEVRESLRRKGVFILKFSMYQEAAFQRGMNKLPAASTFIYQYEELSEVFSLWTLWQTVVARSSVTNTFADFAEFAKESCRHYVDIPMHVQRRGVDIEKVNKLMAGKLPADMVITA